ncbi:DUF305 domain-containing protein [uncultured Devosia sp.]|uniref:DUF305 domain-containing protein n=1 Tax=uncultured Devosia sp. TaxID=211434 RepID=UPI0035C9B616
MRHPYFSLAINIVVGLVIMYFVMFVMIDGVMDFYNNINMSYMAIMMAAPMGPLMLLTMQRMYPRRLINLTLHALFAIAFVAAFIAIRWQVGVGDQQFIRSMIPHHSGAILMCREASLTDAELEALCGTITAGQRREIEQMRTILDRLDATAP